MEEKFNLIFKLWIFLEIYEIKLLRIREIVFYNIYVFLLCVIDRIFFRWGKRR